MTGFLKNVNQVHTKNEIHLVKAASARDVIRAFYFEENGERAFALVLVFRVRMKGSNLVDVYLVMLQVLRIWYRKHVYILIHIHI